MRSHGEGSLFMRRTGRGKGRWVAVVTLRDGRRASRTAKTREEAKAALAELLRLRDARAPVTRNIRLSDYLERWVSDVAVRIAPSTWRKHEAIIRVHLIPALGHVRLSELRTADVEHLLRTSRLGPQSVRHVRATLRRSLADAVREGLVARNVGALAQPPGLPHRERTILDANQARILIESTRNTVYGPLWTLLVTTGLRISEALGLSWSDVDFGGNDGSDSLRGTRMSESTGREVVPVLVSAARPRTGRADQPPLRGSSITVRRQLARENGEWVHRPPKTAKGRRTIPLTALGVEALRAQRTQQREWMAAYYGGSDERATLRETPAARLARSAVPGVPAPAPPRRRHQGADALGSPVTPIDGLVFTTSRGKPLHETNTLAALHRDLAAAGLPRVSQHDLRHLAATIWYRQGLPIEAIADLLGHSTVRVTQDLYRHHVQEFSVLAAERMQEALG